MLCTCVNTPHMPKLQPASQLAYATMLQPTGWVKASAPAQDQTEIKSQAPGQKVQEVGRKQGCQVQARHTIGSQTLLYSSAQQRHVTAATRSRQGDTRTQSWTASLLAPLRPAHLLARAGLQHGGAQPIQPTHGSAIRSCRREDGVGLLLGTDLQPRGNTGTVRSFERASGNPLSGRRGSLAGVSRLPGASETPLGKPSVTGIGVS